jgi:DNA-binding NarL/FixJ family response regulator
MLCPIKILLADDQILSRQGYVSLLEKENDMLVIGEASNGHETIKLLNRVYPDLILMSKEMPVMDGFEASKIIKQKYPSIKIIFLCVEFNMSCIELCENNNYSGILPKNIDTGLFIKAIRQTQLNGNCLDMAYALYFETKELKKEVIQLNNEQRLTNREIEIIALIREGMSNKEIAIKLKITDRTVEFHKKNIYSKLGVKNNVGVVNFDLNSGSRKFLK